MPQELDESGVRAVARLARLKITDEEVARYAAQLSKVLEYMAQLLEPDTTEVEPTSHVLPVTNVFREDVCRASLPRELALRNAPQRSGDLFEVPEVLDQ